LTNRSFKSGFNIDLLNERTIKMSPRTPQQFEEIREERKSQIMETALEHFAREGFHATTINHIAKHAGISKGLMYNYFDSKEALLIAIMHKSVNEMYHFLDIDRDGYLSEEKFELFIRKIYILLNNKKFFWRLLMQLLIQSEVREQFLKSYTEFDSMLHPGHEPGDYNYPIQIIKIVKEYFIRKKAGKSKDYDPDSEFNMFIITLGGFAVISIFSNENDGIGDEKNINRIIKMYK